MDCLSNRNEITTYEDDVEARTASLDDDDYSPHNSWENHNSGRDGAYYDDDDFYDDDMSHDEDEKLSFGEKLTFCFYSLSERVGICCERLVGCIGSRSKKFWIALIAGTILSILAGVGILISNALKSEDDTVSKAVSSDNPIDSREVDIVSILNSLSDPNLFKDESTPQSQAKSWLIASGIDASDKKLTQRYVLSVLYLSLYGEGWTTNDKWMATEELECEWFGIKCDSDGFISEIDLTENNLIGILPSELKHLDKMKDAYFGKNFLDGPIGSCFEMKSLKVLDVSGNQLNGSIPASIGSLEHLGK